MRPGLILGLSLARAEAPPAGGTVTETIEETTVGELGGVRVPMGNMTRGKYRLPDGSEQEGLICSLALPGQTGVFVGLGSVVQVGAAAWEVVAIEKKDSALGSVTLRQR
jgi:hypothetical protein